MVYISKNACKDEVVYDKARHLDLVADKDMMVAGICWELNEQKNTVPNATLNLWKVSFEKTKCDITWL